MDLESLYFYNCGNIQKMVTNKNCTVFLSLCVMSPSLEHDTILYVCLAFLPTLKARKVLLVLDQHIGMLAQLPVVQHNTVPP